MPYLRVYLNNELLEQFELGDKKVTIGRASDNDIVLADQGVSSHHAVIEPRDGRHVLIDNQSTNGTFVNDKAITEHILAFRDEIQIYNFVLKYMPRARLAVTEGLDEAGQKSTEHLATVEISLSDPKALEKLRKQNKVGYLVELKNGLQAQNHRLSDVRFTIGKAKDSNVRVKGWFAPKTAATIIRKHLTYHLVPHNRGKVKLNGAPIQQEQPLNHGDQISVRGRDFVFEYKTDLEA